MSRKFIIIISAVLIISSYFMTMYVPTKAKSERFTTPPTVFVHGYKGTYNSFGNMLKRFEKEYKWGNKALVYRVSPTGQIQVTNLGKKRSNPMFVQVIFENNRASFGDNATWLSLVLNHMKINYQVDSINLVGHSMGGIVSVKYAEEYQDTNQFPVVDKLVTLGSPFDGIYNEEYFKIHQDAAAMDLKQNSTALHTLRSNKNKFPETTDVLSVGSIGDSIAAPESVEAIRMIITENQLQEIMLEDNYLGHSALHESEVVDRIVYEFLYAN